MGTTTRLALDQKLSESIGDFIEVDTTTNITTNQYIVSTALNEYDLASDDYFNEWWVYITEGNNSGILRRISDYTTSTGRLTVYGASLSAEAGAVTIRVYRYGRTNKLLAIDRAIEEIYPSLYKALDDSTLVTGNILPNSHFEDQTTAGTPDKYTLLNVTGSVAQRFPGRRALKLIATAGNGYAYITSRDYPPLLDLMNKTVSFRAWAYPEMANDAFLTIYTVKADGTAQTLNSTTACPAVNWTLLELKDQAINDDIVEIEFRFRVLTNTKYAIFDGARAIGGQNYEHLLPNDFEAGNLLQVYVQSAGQTEYACDELQPKYWERVYSFEITDNSSDKFLRLPHLYPDEHRIRLIGHRRLEDLSSDTDTICIDGEAVNLLIAYAKYKLYQMAQDLPASEDISRYESAVAKAYAEYRRLLTNLKMREPPRTMKLPSY